MNPPNDDLITFWPAIPFAIGEWTILEVGVEPSNDISENKRLTPVEALIWLHLGLPTGRAIELCSQRAKVWPNCRKSWSQAKHIKILKRFEKNGWIGRRKVPLRDHSGSLTSMRQLESAVHKTLKLSEGSTLFVPGPGVACGLPDSKYVDILMFGHNFLFTYYLKVLFPATKVRFWFFSRRHADLAAALIPLPRSACGVLQREDLGRALTQVHSPRHKSRSPKPIRSAASLPVTFIYAGRLNAGKNMAKAIALFLALKARSPNNLQFHIYAPDKRFPIKKQATEHAIYNQDLLSHGVRFMGDIGQNWENLKPCTNPVYITLSTEIWDDFGVSVEHASRRGWKLLLSDWGGLADAQGKVHLVPVSELRNKAWDERFLRQVLRFIQPTASPRERTRRNGRIARYTHLQPDLNSRTSDPFRNMKRLNNWRMGAPDAAAKLPDDFKNEIFRILSGEKR